MLDALCHAVDSFVGMGKNAPEEIACGCCLPEFRREVVPSSAFRALRALIAAADTTSQNQQVTNLQNGCCTNRGKAIKGGYTV
jgi:hypothetical protein